MNEDFNFTAALFNNGQHNILPLEEVVENLELDEPLPQTSYVEFEIKIKSFTHYPNPVAIGIIYLRKVHPLDLQNNIEATLENEGIHPSTSAKVIFTVRKGQKVQNVRFAKVCDRVTTRIAEISQIMSNNGFTFERYLVNNDVVGRGVFTVYSATIKFTDPHPILPLQNNPLFVPNNLIDELNLHLLNVNDE